MCRSDIAGAEVEHAIGTALPADYKALFDTYGIGSMLHADGLT